MESIDMKRKKDSPDAINNFSLSFKDQGAEESFMSQKLANKLRLVLIDQIGFSLMYVIAGIITAIQNRFNLSILFFCAFAYLNFVSLLGRKYNKLFQLTLFVNLLTQMVIFTEFVVAGLWNLQTFEIHMALIIVYVRYSYFIQIMDSWGFRFISLLTWLYYPLRNISQLEMESMIVFFLFFLQVVIIYFFDNKSERMWFISQCSIKEDLQFWKTLFKKNLQSVVFVISLQNLNDIKVEFCNAQGLKDFRAKNKSDFQQKILNDFHINLFENRQYQLFKDFIYSKYNRSQQGMSSPVRDTGYQIHLKNYLKQNNYTIPNSMKSDMDGVNYPNYSTNFNNNDKQLDFRLDEHIYMNSFYIDPQTSTKLYYDVKLVNCQWKNQFGIMAFLTNVPQNNLVNRLQKINQYKDELLATVSHDLKTPLNAMIQVVQTAMNECNNEVYNNYFDIIDKNSKLLLNIINDILDYSQIMKGKLRLTHQIFSIHQVIQEVHDLLKYQFQDKGIEFLIEIENDIQVSNDQNRLKQILNNIIGNALKFTFSGYVKVKVTSVPENQSISICVEDTGTGIEPSLQPKLFQLYSTFDHNKGSNKHGVGLGLAICKKLVQLMGPLDTIQLISEKGKGSKFIFEIYQNLDIQRANKKTKSAILESKRSLDNSSLIYSPEYKKNNSLNMFHHSLSINQNNSNPQNNNNNYYTNTNTNFTNYQDLIQSFVQQQPLPLLTQQQSSLQKQQNQSSAPQVSTISHMNSNTNFTSIKSHNIMGQVSNSQFTNIFTNYGMSAPSLTGYFPNSHRQNILNGIIENNDEGNYLESDIKLPFTKKANQEETNTLSLQQPATNSNQSRTTPAHNRLLQDNMNRQFKILTYNDIDDDQSKSSENKLQQHSQLQQSSTENKENSIRINFMHRLSRKENTMQIERSILPFDYQTPKRKQDHSRESPNHPKSLTNAEENIQDISPHFPSSNQASMVIESQDFIEFKRDEDFNDLKGHILNNYTFIEQKKYHILENYLKQTLKRILIVDDTPFNIRALKIVLENIISSPTVEILQAFNGQQSLDVLNDCLTQNKQVDLIFMDINMPVMDGYEATKKIRMMEQYDNTKIIFATAYSEYSDIWKQNNTGGDGYLQKPIQRSDLLRILRDLSLHSFNQNHQNA